MLPPEMIRYILLFLEEFGYFPNINPKIVYLKKLPKIKYIDLCFNVHLKIKNTEKYYTIIYNQFAYIVDQQTNIRVSNVFSVILNNKKKDIERYCSNDKQSWQCEIIERENIIDCFVLRIFICICIELLLLSSISNDYKIIHSISSKLNVGFLSLSDTIILTIYEMKFFVIGGIFGYLNAYIDKIIYKTKQIITYYILL